jgi:hypothetical protein
MSCAQTPSPARFLVANDKLHAFLTSTDIICTCLQLQTPAAFGERASGVDLVDVQESVLDISTLAEGRDTLSRNVGNKLPVYTWEDLRRAKTVSKVVPTDELLCTRQ